MSTSTLSEVAEETSAAEQTSPALPWQVVVWDDPVNTMDYVEYVFQSYFNYSRRRAHTLMLQVHQSGQAVVAEGSREKAETDVMAMHSFGLQATVRQGGHE
ncbi:ATP-dependent Clp protease adapter ClpS [Psychromicrobium sp. YIM B11713]|uniref:ATP-dependent Clp protease adapter ClpS n=1 Tax=Psychromicrobium sp. YIM B11713 TaxID=3145233 RepID=UPI00374F6AA8